MNDVKKIAVLLSITTLLNTVLARAKPLERTYDILVRSEKRPDHANWKR